MDGCLDKYMWIVRWMSRWTDEWTIDINIWVHELLMIIWMGTLIHGWVGGRMGRMYVGVLLCVCVG